MSINSKGQTPEQEFIDRQMSIMDVFDEYAYQNKVEGFIDISNATVRAIIKSYSDDINRASQYHSLNVANEVKQAAYVTKWLLKLRPVFLINEKGRQMPKQALLANEGIAIEMSLSLLKIPPLPEIQLNNFLYTFAYRRVTADMLMLTYDSITKIAQALKTPS